MPHQEDFAKQLTKIVQSLSSVPINALGPDDKFISTGLIDSVNIVEIIAFVESYSKIEVDPTELSIDNFDSVTAISNYVSRKLADG